MRCLGDLACTSCTTSFVSRSSRGLRGDGGEEMGVGVGGGGEKGERGGGEVVVARSYTVDAVYESVKASNCDCCCSSR